MDAKRLPPWPTWCPICGPYVLVESDGTCRSCGADAMGEGADAALQALADVERLTRELREAREALLEYAPKCLDCGGHATVRSAFGDLLCDHHGFTRNELPHAPAIRAAEGGE